ncbi:uncharacterized protein C8Q71DRAFT_380248 [Rhodofomes roseus]|uniref:F-box domain-containing protein n=1 Tax=Rhodofomes roseus TaxID=34475 RepID=A0ABQ8K0G7_9APHY|nr:uncharacterized protein C8Q71DRAFT_380248 [Rhodofomes roseus]KAH9830149.1 hypothetical protein C8Q71DRAFT_380248 [Rhodofomes roseus]
MNPYSVLNDDVLNIILSLLPPSDAGKLACTCRLAYFHATPRFLSDVTLGLHFHRRPKSQIASFCNFVLADVSNRVDFLRKLDLRRDAFPWIEVEIAGPVGNPRSGRAYMVDYSMAGLLAEVVQQAVRLDEVYIAGADPLLASEPRLVDALASRPRLRHLSLEKCGSASLECISRLSGAVRSLAVSIDDQYVRESSLYHDLSAFTRVAKTLAALELDDAVFLTNDLDPDFVLPSVRQLTLRGWADLSEILHILPNLRAFHLHTCRFKAAPLSSSLVDLPDTQLDELVTDAPVPLTCAVRRVELQFNAFLQHNALAMLERMDPVVLSCHAGWSLPARSVARLLPSLRFLELHVKWRIADGVPESPREAWLISLVSVFRPLKLTGLCLRIGPGVMVEHATAIDPDALVRDVASACNHALQYVGLSFAVATSSTMWWRWIRMDTVEAHPQLERLAEWEGELIERQLRETERTRCEPGPCESSGMEGM